MFPSIHIFYRTYPRKTRQKFIIPQYEYTSIERDKRTIDRLLLNYFLFSAMNVDGSQSLNLPRNASMLPSLLSAARCLVSRVI